MFFFKQISFFFSLPHNFSVFLFSSVFRTLNYFKHGKSRKQHIFPFFLFKMQSNSKSCTSVIKPTVCRPKQLTCRWLTEISTAIFVLCSNDQTKSKQQCESINKCPYPIHHCVKNKTNSLEMNTMWQQYLKDLYSSSCFQQSAQKAVIKQILAFELDYNTVLQTKEN